jgi:DNA helicase IV
MWPRLSGQELLHDLYGAPALIRAAANGLLSDAEMKLLERPRSHSMGEIPWSDADAALIDEARILLGPRRRPRSITRSGETDILGGIDLDAYSGDVRQAALREAARHAQVASDELDEAEFVTYGHIVVDEAQDLSPMQLRVLRRRDLTGSMTIVGDMGQATTAASAASWDATLAVLNPRRAPLQVTLSVSYRTPEEVLEFAGPTLKAASPELDPPRPVRRAGSSPVVERVAPERFAKELATITRREIAALSPGRVALIVKGSRVSEIVELLQDQGIDAIDPRESGSRGLGADLVVLAAEGSNGLEFDGVIVIEPAQIAARGSHDASTTLRGLRTLYVAMTRPTRRLAIVHTEDLPPTLM